MQVRHRTVHLLRETWASRLNWLDVCEASNTHLGRRTHITRITLFTSIENGGKQCGKCIWRKDRSEGKKHVFRAAVCGFAAFSR
jgi:hypothetical protein